MGDSDHQSPETNFALLKQSVEGMSKQLETNNGTLQKVVEAIHQIQMDNKSLYITEKHHKDRLDDIDIHLKKHVERIDDLELSAGQVKGGLSVAKWSIGVASTIVWSVICWLIANAYQEIKSTHDIAILNQQAVQRISEHPEDKHK